MGTGTRWGMGIGAMWGTRRGEGQGRAGDRDGAAGWGTSGSDGHRRTGRRSVDRGWAAASDTGALHALAWAVYHSSDRTDKQVPSDAVLRPGASCAVMNICVTALNCVIIKKRNNDVVFFPPTLVTTL